MSWLSEGRPPLNVIVHLRELLVPEHTHVFVLRSYHRLWLPVPAATEAKPWLDVVLKRTVSLIFLKFRNLFVRILNLDSFAKLPVDDAAISTHRCAELKKEITYAK